MWRYSKRHIEFYAIDMDFLRKDAIFKYPGSAYLADLLAKEKKRQLPGERVYAIHCMVCSWIVLF